MLNTCAYGGGNLLLNIGPKPDGSVPEDAVEPLTKVGEWLKVNDDAVYGSMIRNKDRRHPSFRGNGLTDASRKGNTIYLWNWIWPKGGEMGIGGYLTAPESVTFIKDGTPVDFDFKGNRILLRNLPETAVDEILGISVIEMKFNDEPKFVFASHYPQINGGKKYD